MTSISCVSFVETLWRKVPIILYSAASDEDSCVECVEAETPTYIAPFSERQLLALVRAHLRVVQMRNESIQTLRLSEERFRTLEDNDDSRRLGSRRPTARSSVNWPGGGKELTGQTPEQYRGFGYLDVVHPADKPRVIETCQNALRNKTAYQQRVQNQTVQWLVHVCTDSGSARA